MTSANPTISIREARALRAFARSNGAHWRKRLRVAWETGDYRTATGDAPAHLQHLRNNLGAEGLARFSTPIIESIAARFDPENDKHRQREPERSAFAEINDFDPAADSFESDFGPRASLRPIPAAPRFRDRCEKCRGTGRFMRSGRDLGTCFACKGQGAQTFATSSDDRAKGRAQASARKARNEAESFEMFATANVEVWAWIESAKVDFPFAAAMREAIAKFGDLTENQIAACHRSITARQAAREAAAERKASAPAIATDRLMAAFDKATAAGLKRPKMRFEGFTASLAPATGTNPGAVYLKNAGRLYLGKITGGKLFTSRECDAETRAAIVATMADPLNAAVAYGRRIGSCSCCGRELTDRESVARGIGPICADKFGL